MEGKITVSRREFQRMRVFREVVEKRMTLVAAAALIGTSYRQAERLFRYVVSWMPGREKIFHGTGYDPPHGTLSTATFTTIL